MVKIIGVRFRNVGKIYYFNPKSFQMKPGDHVIVETARGVEYGTVVLGPKEVEDKQVVQPLKDVIRMATQKDDAKEESNRKKEKEAYQICVKKIRAHQLEMKLIDVEYTFDNNKILFYFTADGRIDFRELVKDLAAIFKTRIELRQIGSYHFFRILFCLFEIHLIIFRQLCRNLFYALPVTDSLPDISACSVQVDHSMKGFACLTDRNDHCLSCYFP